MFKFRNEVLLHSKKIGSVEMHRVCYIIVLFSMHKQTCCEYSIQYLCLGCGKKKM